MRTASMCSTIPTMPIPRRSSALHRRWRDFSESSMMCVFCVSSMYSVLILRAGDAHASQRSLGTGLATGPDRLQRPLPLRIASRICGKLAAGHLLVCKLGRIGLQHFSKTMKRTQVVVDIYDACTSLSRSSRASLSLASCW